MMRLALSGAAAVLLMESLLVAQTPTPVSVVFRAVVGDAPFACGQTYSGLGRTKSTVSVTDFRIFVSRLSLVTADGTAVPVALTQDGVWQHDDVALLDFEDGTGSCANGTPEVHTTLDGAVPPGAYVGVRFDVGLPFDVNHRDPTLQPSPLNLSRLFWNWSAGYKFARIDLKTTGQPQGWVLHLGSTGCEPFDGPTSVPSTCAHENRPRILLAPFDAARHAVRFDLAALLADADLDGNTPDTASGCMSGPTDPECGPLFAALGLPFADRPASAQAVFSAVAKAKPAAQ